MKALRPYWNCKQPFSLHNLATEVRMAEIDYGLNRPHSKYRPTAVQLCEKCTAVVKGRSAQFFQVDFDRLVGKR